MSEDKKESIADKKVSRRSMLKWTGALAAGVVIGGAAVYGATYKAPPPPPPSLKPPLSPEIQTRVDTIVQDLVNRHTGEEVMYGACQPNCAAINQCVMKFRLKNGVVTAIDANDEQHPNVAMEDAVMTQQDFDLARFQRRGCSAHWGFLSFYYSPDRVLYPLKRAPGAQRGDGNFVRVSWDEALNTLSTTMQQTRDKYGPFAIMSAYSSSTIGRLGSLWGAGCGGWGACSDDAARVIDIFTGIGWMSSTGVGNDMMDGLKYSKLQIHIGSTPSTTHFVSGYSGVWYTRMAREKGVPIILIDPKYTWDAEVMGTQYIPIKPGTDAAMLLAMANVIIKENLYDPAWVDKWMYGFQQQSDYIMGKSYDLVEKTPEWAEKICGVPADTIRALAELFAKTKPARLARHASVTRKSRGEYGLKIVEFLQVLTSNAPYVHGGQAGGASSGNCGWAFPPSLGSGQSLPGAAATGPVCTTTVCTTGFVGPMFYRCYQWWKAATYALTVKNGGPSIMHPGQTMTWDEWATLVGYQADPAFKTMFDPHLLFIGGASNPGPGSNYLVMAENTNAQIKAVMAMDFVLTSGTKITSTAKYVDMFLPLVDPTFEETWFGISAYGGTSAFTYHPGIVKNPGEGKTDSEWMCLLAEKLGGMGLAKQWFKYYTGASDWDANWQAFLKDSWETASAPWIQAKGKTPLSWDVVKAGKTADAVFMRCEEYGDGNTFAGQNTVIDTKSGKVEIYTDLLAAIQADTTGTLRNTQHFDWKGRKYAHVPNDTKDFAPIAIYQPAVNGMEDAKTKKYPLMILTGKSRFRMHYLFADPPSPTFMDCYRHSVIISTADAKTRGIKDGDLCRVWNDQGQTLVPAYVTNRIMPGVVQVRCGMPLNFTKDGMDHGGSSNIFTGGDDISTVGPAKVTNLVDVELYQAGEAF